jgi:hypothetical protein
MSTNTEIEKKSEELTSKNEPENDGVECLEYNFKVRCIKSRDGTRSCEIQDITVIDPKNTQMTPAESVEVPQKDKAPTATTPVIVPDDKKEGGCSLCEALEGALKDNARAPAPRRLPPSMRPRRMIRA